MTRIQNIVIGMVLFLIFGTSAYSQDPYSKYGLQKKNISELEWRLVQINLKLAESGNVVIFDNWQKIFKVDKFIDTHTLLRTPAPLLRQLLISQWNLIKAVIGSEFAEFKDRENQDLVIKYLIGETGAGDFAVIKNGSFSFTDNYYKYLQQHER